MLRSRLGGTPRSAGRFFTSVRPDNPARTGQFARRSTPKGLPIDPSFVRSLLRPDLAEMIAAGDEAGLRAFTTELYPAVAAEVIDDLPAEEIREVLRHGEPGSQAAILEFLPLARQVEVVEGLSADELAAVVDEMSADDRVDLLERLGTEAAATILPLLPRTDRDDIRRLLSYPEDTAGAILTTEFASLPERLTVGDAIRRLRREPSDRETIYYIYITDAGGRLTGFVSLRRLLTADPDTPLAEIVQRDIISARVSDPAEDVARDLLKYDFLALPVVDERNRLIGIVTYDDAADVTVEEAEEDAQRSAAVVPLDDGYLDTPLPTLCWKRGVWLVLLLGAAFLTAWVLSRYETSGGSGWMVLFIPLVLASGGNAGSQSATLVIRAIALEGDAEDRAADLFRRIVRKETLVGVLLGIGLATLSMGVSAVLLDSWAKCATVALTVLLVVLLGTFLGAALPISFRRMGLDPALMSTPLIAALVDVLGVVIYYETARLLV